MRIATLPHQRVILDKDQRGGGRGAYLCPVMDCVVTAAKTNAWERHLKRPVERQTLVDLLRQLSQNALWMTGDPKRLWQTRTLVR